MWHTMEREPSRYPNPSISILKFIKKSKDRSGYVKSKDNIFKCLELMKSIFKRLKLYLAIRKSKNYLENIENSHNILMGV